MENNKLQSEVIEQKSMSIFENQNSFELAQRMATALAKSTIVPTDYRGNLSNALIALDMSNRLGISPMMVMQNLYIVNGRPSWSSQFIIAAINNSKRFAESLKFELQGTGDNMSCYAYTKDYEGNGIKGPAITMKMAKSEGWVSKKGSKWQTMPEVMIRYRAASFFGRLYCSDLLMGIYSEDESENIGKSTIEPVEKVPDTFNLDTEDKTEEPQKEIIDVDYEEKFEDTPFEMKEDEADGTN